MQNPDIKLFVLLATAAVAILLIIIVWRRYIYANNPTKALKKRSFDLLQNASIEIDLDNTAYFDYLLLLEDRVLVVMVKNYPGNIYGSSEINEWTQIIGTRSYKFNNPFIELSRDIELLKSIFPEIEIEGLLLFGKDAQFPTSRPEFVITLNEIKEKYKTVKKNQLSDVMRENWNKLRMKLSK